MRIRGQPHYLEQYNNGKRLIAQGLLTEKEYNNILKDHYSVKERETDMFANFKAKKSAAKSTNKPFSFETASEKPVQVTEKKPTMTAEGIAVANELSKKFNDFMIAQEKHNKKTEENQHKILSYLVSDNIDKVLNKIESLENQIKDLSKELSKKLEQKTAKPATIESNNNNVPAWVKGMPVQNGRNLDIYTIIKGCQSADDISEALKQAWSADRTLYGPNIKTKLIEYIASNLFSDNQQQDKGKNVSMIDSWAKKLGVDTDVIRSAMQVVRDAEAGLDTVGRDGKTLDLYILDRLTEEYYCDSSIALSFVEYLETL